MSISARAVYWFVARRSGFSSSRPSAISRASSGVVSFGYPYTPILRLVSDSPRITRRLRPDSRRGGRSVFRSAPTTDARCLYSPNRRMVSHAKYTGLKPAMRAGPPNAKTTTPAAIAPTAHFGHRQITATATAQARAIAASVPQMPFQYNAQNSRSSSLPLAIQSRNQSPSIVVPNCDFANQSAPRTSRQYPTTAAIPPRISQPNTFFLCGTGNSNTEIF